MINKLRHITMAVFLILSLKSIYAQQSSDSSKVSFDRIFGESKLHKYNADTLVMAAGRKVIYSGSECALAGFNAKGRQIWIRNFPENQCSLEAMMFMNPLKKGSRYRKGCELLIQYNDKTIYAVNVKTGKFYFVE